MRIKESPRSVETLRDLPTPMRVRVWQGQGFPGASLGLQRPALLLCPGQASSEMAQPPRASVSPVKGVCLCAVSCSCYELGALSTLGRIWDRKMGWGSGAPFALGLASKSRAVLLQMPPLRALLSIHGCSGALTPWLPLSDPDCKAGGWHRAAGDVGMGDDAGQVSAPPAPLPAALTLLSPRHAELQASLSRVHTSDH